MNAEIIAQPKTQMTTEIKPKKKLNARMLRAHATTTNLFSDYDPEKQKRQIEEIDKLCCEYLPKVVEANKSKGITLDCSDNHVKVCVNKEKKALFKKLISRKS